MPTRDVRLSSGAVPRYATVAARWKPELKSKHKVGKLVLPKEVTATLCGTNDCAINHFISIDSADPAV